MDGAPEFELELVGEKTLKAIKGQTVLDAALAGGIPHFHACGGNAECSTCRVLVIEGMSNLSPINKYEEELRKTISLPKNMRLACQTKVESGPVKLRRIILDEADIPVYIKEEMSSAVAQQLGEKKELVLFFLDIRNFTPFVEAYLPFDVIHVMRAVHSIFNSVIKRFDGVIIDTAGDGFYAVFGLRSNIGEAANKAIQAGSTIHEELKRFNETYLDPYFGTQLEIGIGLHCGEVIVGEVVVGQKSHLSVMGLAVNIASRIQASTRKLDNSFIVSREVMDKLKVEPPEKGRIIRLRGISGVFKVYLIGEPYKSSIPT